MMGLTRYSLTAALFIFLFAPLWTSYPAEAADNWLQKGSDLLKTFGQQGDASTLSTEEISAGLKDALRVGTDNVVNQLGQVNGFYEDPAIRIPLPDQIDNIKSMLDKLGLSGQLQELEVRLNRAAEKATPRAKALFLQAITEMTFDDVRSIYNGPKDAATQYFRKKMSPELAREMEPVVTETLSQVKAVQTYDRIMKDYQSIPFVPDVNANLTDYVVEKGMDGIFYYVAKEEAAIRTNPAKRTTDLLKRVFGGQ